jgi:uracil-DNA glycosylase
MSEIDDLMQRTERFLANQLEMYGSVIFDANTIADVDQTKSVVENAASTQSKTDETHQQIANVDSPIAVVSTDSLPVQHGGIKQYQNPEIVMTAELQAIKTLDELQAFCEKADELKTDLPDTRLVFGKGNPQADLMIIGEAPGAEEDRLGEPFVGRSGQLLTKILEAIKFSREDVFIANIVKHRPPDNRNPTAEERRVGLPYLMRQIELINPKLILCLGKISAETLLGKPSAMKDMRGEFHAFEGRELMVTYHPAALLRNPNWKRDTWEDVKLLRKRYDELGCKP